MRRGLTLVEVCVAMLVMGVVMAGAYGFLAFGTRSAGRTGARVDAVETVSRAFLQVSRRLRWADTLTTPARGAEGDRLELSNLDTGAWVLSVVEGDGLVLQEAHGAGREVLSPGVSRVHFDRSSLAEDGMIVLTLTHGTGPAARDYSTVLYLRGLGRRAGR